MLAPKLPCLQGLAVVENEEETVRDVVVKSSRLLLDHLQQSMAEFRELRDGLDGTVTLEPCEFVEAAVDAGRKHEPRAVVVEFDELPALRRARRNVEVPSAEEADLSPLLASWRQLS